MYCVAHANSTFDSVAARMHAKTQLAVLDAVIEHEESLQGGRPNGEGDSGTGDMLTEFASQKVRGGCQKPTPKASTNNHQTQFMFPPQDASFETKQAYQECRICWDVLDDESKVPPRLVGVLCLPPCNESISHPLASFLHFRTRLSISPTS